MISFIIQYTLNILVSIDRLANTLLGGTPDQTISQRLWRDWPNSPTRKFVDFLFGTNHCEDAVITDDDTRPILK